ncbi:hypothetical protein [Mucilaginibacter sp. UYCu711]|uniref:hypothetical protein n=1 Tax=Mucilaginibacter sp. UYCu711 TaxID=3156339 RepID=UPI003D1932AE
MKKHIALSLLVLAMAGSSFAQQVKLNKDTSGFAKSPLYVFKVYGDNQEFTAAPLLGLIDQNLIASMEILKDKTADDMYGAKAKNGVIIITLTQGTEIHPLTYLLDQFNIKPKFRTLPLYINNTLTRSTTDMFYAPNKIKTVTIEKEKGTGMKYVSIITNDYSPNAAPDKTFRIRGEGTSGM